MRDIIASIKRAIHPVYQGEKIVGTCFTSDAGCVITCAHVIENMEQPAALIAGEKVALTPIMQDRSFDVAICKVARGQLDNGLTLGCYDDAEEGDEALMCGFPLGLNYHVTHKGIISAKGIINGRHAFQVDASINRGNSGGPCIVITQGKPRVIGVIATRLVDVDFSQLRELLIAFEENGNRPKVGSPGVVAAGAMARILHKFTNDVGETLNQFNRYLNVGFGEAVSIDHAVTAIRSCQSEQTLSQD